VEQGVVLGSGLRGLVDEFGDVVQQVDGDRTIGDLLMAGQADTLPSDVCTLLVVQRARAFEVVADGLELFALFSDDTGPVGGESFDRFALPAYLFGQDLLVGCFSIDGQCLVRSACHPAAADPVA